MELVFALVTLSFTSFIDASSASTMVELSGGRRSSNGACEKDKWFQCMSMNECVALEMVCNGLKECADGSDELGCFIECKQGSSHHFQCSSGHCISKLWRCDGKVDCPDRSDEDQVHCRSHYNDRDDHKTCHEHEFACASGNECIPELWQCDHTVDCHDKSDEDEALCRAANITCATGEFHCSTSGDCIPQYWLCDGMVDCNDKSDENATFCREYLYGNSKCPEGLYSCRDEDDEQEQLATFIQPSLLECLSPNVVCDGKADCSNGKDEKNCPLQPPSSRITCLEAQEFACDMDYDQSQLRCLPVEKRCDGITDCLDGSDEDTCLNESPSENHRAILNLSRVDVSTKQEEDERASKLERLQVMALLLLLMIAILQVISLLNSCCRELEC